MIIGFLIKEPAIMFVPLLFVYEWLFGTVNRRFNVQILVLAGMAIVLFMISRALTPEAWTPGGVSRWEYLITQPFVIFHYISNFVLPLNLAVDTDWAPFTSVFDDRVLFGVVMITVLIAVIVRCSRKEKLKPVAFGLAWFLIALVPTSSIIPLAEVLNDHRTYFPYIGLIIAAVAGLGLLLDYFSNRATSTNKHRYKQITIAAMLVLIVVHAGGAYQRSTIWKTELSLWKDCVLKCPGNGRALTNYGNELLEVGVEELQSGDSITAQRYFNQADTMYFLSTKVWPDYFNTYVNIGALREWQHRDVEAEANYRKAISLRIEQPDAYCWLADFLVRKNRYSEAIPFITKGLELSPNHQKLNSLQQIVSQRGQTKDAVTIARETAQQNPTPENYINLSLVCYNAFDFSGTITASEKAIELSPDFAEAYNNICAANNMLGKYDEAVIAGKKAVELNPASDLFKNNLQEALRLQGEKKK
jgi:tetratricopeptide (TPR) repeat protein